MSIETDTKPDTRGPWLEATDWQDLYSAHAQSLYRYVVRRVGESAAEDIVADAFLEAWRIRDRYNANIAQSRSWLFGVATNKIRHYYRAEARRLKAAARNIAAEGPTVSNDPADLGWTLDSQLALALSNLRIEEREVMLLVAWGDLTPLEISRVLGLTPATVRTRLFRARTALKRSYPQVLDRS
ncbi:sigma-70 family RNA polymerase sigma factor [Rhodococcus hoagii]|uniref:RNA polymerase sigma factor n=1 Tax=Rhodococcus hoagii TaxID=43767 RepID=UPI0019658904|nr:sigma-70 family RNA polymerase sigma factor [Prescottella equi]MBM9838660.1 sigma-70 family RNA polymerase sigma factor [Prescottella equi]NKR65241.1 sigma-70 family RNA polymerase sigma factor [Prescottella equi]NKR80737.1 sigma-70 family RNA polymerase sigma factor [Prescottella equi]NKS78176.1 sigma-70 family RNA polymerase sigma factor [Prescottella equi]NKS99517.1 sigma-70 family RNA polymerase sigma factor [Prescottella equi]